MQAATKGTTNHIHHDYHFSLSKTSLFILLIHTYYVRYNTMQCSVTLKQQNK